MARKLSPWCKWAQISLKLNDMNASELADKVNLTREYTSAVINGRAYSEPAVNAISDVLNISPSPSEAKKFIESLEKKFKVNRSLT